MFGKLHQAYCKVVEIEESGRRYLGTYLSGLLWEG